MFENFVSSLAPIAWISCVVVQATIHYVMFARRKEKLLQQQQEEQLEVGTEAEIEAEILAAAEIEEIEHFSRRLLRQQQQQEEEEHRGASSSSTIREKEEDEDDDKNDEGHDLFPQSDSFSSSCCAEESQSSLTKENAILLQQRLFQSFPSSTASSTSSGDGTKQHNRSRSIRTVFGPVSPSRLNKSISSINNDPKFYLMHRTGSEMLKRCTLERRVEEQIEAVPE